MGGGTCFCNLDASKLKVHSPCSPSRSSPGSYDVLPLGEMALVLGPAPIVKEYPYTV